MISLVRFLSFIFCFTLVALMPLSAEAQLGGGFNAFKNPTQGKGSVSGPNLEAAEESFDGGKISIGSTTDVLAFFENTGSAAVNVLNVDLYPSSTVQATVKLNKCAETALPPEGRCAIVVAVTGVETGAWRVELLLDHNGVTRLTGAVLQGSVEGARDRDTERVRLDIESVPETLNFSTVSSAIPVVKSILLRNRTADPISLGAVKLDGAEQSGFSYTSECPDQLAAAETCVVNVRWTPLTPGQSEVVLTVPHSGNNGLTKIDVSGTYQPATTSSATLYPDAVADMGLLVSDRDSIDFGSAVNGVSSITMTLVNTGVSVLQLRSIRLAGSDNGLTLSRTGCRPGLLLDPTEACAMTVTWVPNREGAVIDDLQILHTGARGVLVLPIRGTATAPAVQESAKIIRQPSVASSSSGMADAASGPSDDPPDLDAIANALSDMASPLEGYSITSHMKRKAVISGPTGSLIIHDGQSVLLSGITWVATVVSDGVVLSDGAEEILLLFDKAFRPAGIAPMATQAIVVSSDEGGDN